jgi:TrkA domain protein
MDIEETRLPGIGLRHDFVTRTGRRLGIVSQRNGERDLVVYDPDDPDACSTSIVLSDEESDALAELLGAPRIVQRLKRLRDEVEGLVTRGVTVRPGSPYDGRTLGTTQARTRTSASIVAVVRRGEFIASPGPDFAFCADDKVVTVGTAEGVGAVDTIFTDG